MNLPLHGSNPEQLYKSLQINIPDHYIDFSVNLNPLGTLQTIQLAWPDWIRYIEDYPEPQNNYLKSLIAKNNGVYRKNVLVGNGGSQLITLIAQYFRKKNVTIVQPTFVEYKKMCQVFSCNINHVVLTENNWEQLSTIDEHINDSDVLFLCHPNNPTGVTYGQNELETLIKRCNDDHCYIVIDEAFYDFANEQITTTNYLRKYENVIIVRSLTKMYSIAGLRLGYLLGSAEIVKALSEMQPYWSVNALAQQAGVLCITDQQFAQQSRQYITKERNRLFKKLRKYNYVMSNSKVNFFILRDPTLINQLPLIKFLLQNGIVPRHTENFRGLNGRWIRLAIKSQNENNKLLNVLISWKKYNVSS